MEDYKPTREEQETILIFNREDDCWIASTNIASHMSKFEKAGWNLTEDLGYEKAYRAPKKAISIRKPEQRKREYTQEEKERLRLRMKKIREESK